MKYLFYLLLIALLFNNKISDAQKAIKLFNGQNFDGWYAYNAETGKHPIASDLFAVDQQMIRMFGKDAGYLMTKKSFDKFELIVEYRWNTDTTFIRKSNGRNSGVMYLVPSYLPDVLWPKGIQFQVKQGGTGDFILLTKISLTVRGEEIAPGRSVAVPRIVDAEKPVGEWNTIKVTFDGETIKQELNGVLVNEGTHPSVQEGRILLQYEGYPIDFRKVELIEL